MAPARVASMPYRAPLETLSEPFFSVTSGLHCDPAEAETP